MNHLRHLMLMYGGFDRPWTVDDLRYYVAHQDSRGRSDDWLFDSFLFLNVKASEQRDFCADVNLGTSMSGEGDFFAMVSPRPATKADWEELLEFYLGPEGSIATLERTIEACGREIGVMPSQKRNVILMLPYPHNSQRAWGKLAPDGPELDFGIGGQNLMKATQQRLAAEKWFVDEIARRWNERAYEHVHLLGVYWMFESVYRSWDVDDHWLLKELRLHVHRHGLITSWIPFWATYNLHLLDDYRAYYFDLAFLQPNYMFYRSGKTIEGAARAARERNAGIEIEYYLELDEPIAITGERHSRFRDYLNGGVTYGYMLDAACAHFQGVGSLRKMHRHDDPQEREFYEDIYHFVKGDYQTKPPIPPGATDISQESQTDVAIAVDLGGTNLRAAVVTLQGEVLERESVPTPGTREEIIAAMTVLVRHAKVQAGGRRLRGVGVSTGGRVDHANGVVVDSTAVLPGWSGVPLAMLLERETGLGVWVDHDGKCAAMAEARFGVLRAASNAIVVAVGTGIGGGVILNGALVRGEANAAGEMGHLSIDAEGPPCSCGSRGCVELYASGSGLARLSRELGEPLTAEEIGVRARRGDRMAQEILKTGGAALGIALSGLVNALNPEVVVVGGSVLKSGHAYVEALRTAFHERTMRVQREGVRLVVSTLEDAGLLGAATLVFDRSAVQC
ncbi:MAG: ROK family protein [Bacteroidetes bacterium]|jgi:predicted NBD/HSP70 family sugar kinase|nr:ROK family protein [Bacteroidota bacterium]